MATYDAPNKGNAPEASYDLSKLPPLKDLTIDNITENVKLINSQCPNARLKYILERLVQHLHDFARETRLSHEEWMTGLLFLTRVGQICTDVRQEYILLSDILGLSLLVDAISHPKPPASTAGTVLGPFHTHDANNMSHGSILSHDEQGKPLLVTCRVVDTSGQPIPEVKIDIWETDSTGNYDVQHPDRNIKGPDGRGVLRSDANGDFWFKGIVPVEYPIPHDGPVGQLLQKLGRHPFRPAHMHFMFEKDGFDHLITALYVKGDPYESSDAVFGVKQALIVELSNVQDKGMAEKFGVEVGCRLLQWEFVLVSADESARLKDKLAREAMDTLGLQHMKIVDGLPVPDVD